MTDLKNQVTAQAELLKVGHWWPPRPLSSSCSNKDYWMSLPPQPPQLHQPAPHAAMSLDQPDPPDQLNATTVESLDTMPNRARPRKRRERLILVEPDSTSVKLEDTIKIQLGSITTSLIHPHKDQPAAVLHDGHQRLHPFNTPQEAISVPPVTVSHPSPTHSSTGYSGGRYTPGVGR